MGQTIKQLSKRELQSNTIFPNRFVIEVCEEMHVHYRNVRFLFKQDLWRTIAEGFKASFDRWIKQGEPKTGNRHIELCRKEVHPPKNEMMCVNLNTNLYKKYKGRVFSEGNKFDEDKYIHLKYRDIRIEMPIAEFKEFASMVKEANDEL